MLKKYFTLKRKQIARRREMRATRNALLSWHKLYDLCNPYKELDNQSCLNKVRGFPGVFECAHFTKDACLVDSKVRCKHRDAYSCYDRARWHYNNTCDDLHDFWQEFWDNFGAKFGQIKYWVWQKENKGNVK